MGPVGDHGPGRVGRRFARRRVIQPQQHVVERVRRGPPGEDLQVALGDLGVFFLGEHGRHEVRGGLVVEVVEQPGRQQPGRRQLVGGVQTLDQLLLHRFRDALAVAEP
ncbi:MAG: hypothetical protein ACYSUF_10845, partial [Planctomycetota bacterium]